MKITRNFSIDRDIFDALKNYSQTEGKAMSQIVEDCITTVLPSLQAGKSNANQSLSFEEWKEARK
jgi:hypothetical protein